jgi:hypothetical protein|tara:strand:+ start:1032 stop:1427 length:396 start_codon:yes stop_codon:yes gene_type:complete
MDLQDLTPSEDTVDVTLLHPNTEEVLKNDDKTPMVITMYAPHSKVYKSAMHEQTNKQLKKVRVGKNELDFTAEDIEQSSLDVLVKTTKAWNITYKGETPKLTKAKEVYEEVFWIKDQIEEALKTSLDFTKK